MQIGKKYSMKKFVLFLLLITMGGVSAQTGVNVFDIHPYAALQNDASSIDNAGD